MWAYPLDDAPGYPLPGASPYLPDMETNMARNDLSTLSKEERSAALAAASAARRRRAEVRALLKSRALSIGEFLDMAETEDALGRMKVSYLIASMPGYANVKAAAFMADNNIAPTRRVAGLGSRQTEALLNTFGA